MFQISDLPLSAIATVTGTGPSPIARAKARIVDKRAVLGSVPTKREAHLLWQTVFDADLASGHLRGRLGAVEFLQKYHYRLSFSRTLSGQHGDRILTHRQKIALACPVTEAGFLC